MQTILRTTLESHSPANNSQPANKRFLSTILCGVLAMPILVLFGSGCGAADDSNLLDETSGQTSPGAEPNLNPLSSNHQVDSAKLGSQSPGTEYRAICDWGYTCIANCWGGEWNWFEVTPRGKGSCTADANYECFLKGKADRKAWGVCFGTLY